jgi:hypothetical protein
MILPLIQQSLIAKLVDNRGGLHVSRPTRLLIIFAINFSVGARVVEMIMQYMKVKRVLPHIYFAYIVETPVKGLKC